MTQHKLPDLPYPMDALEPHISAETLEYHYGIHHATYVDKLNKLIPGSGFEESPLEQISKEATGSLFNNASQVWNHTFYWNCLSPDGGGSPTGSLAVAIDEAFGSFAEFREAFSGAAATHFGSGWAWLTRTDDSKLEIVTTSNADNPLADNRQPLLTCDVWEHAYYIDYRNARPDYIDAFWNIVNWEFVADNLSR
ncbi:superoxide dismutase [Sulfuriflexus sp.]|uniref:superoxide dismutase n=1 Tax=Sulfuriflexus sp. TaxID=2015443 RepID=UPI0028CC9C3B|nr:superoxide dismutase [Sulfuriflexus sp.]MDT8405308.1 superoxide dismutase [Sulfuriflexus sp.]